MASLTRRTLILVICRVLNFGIIVLLSPMIMVRIFDVNAYGQYREFVLYYMLISGVVCFSVMSSLIYFIPKFPDRERQSVTHTALMLLILGSIGAAGTWLFGDVIRAHTSIDFVLPLVVHVFLIINLEYYESYALGKKRTDLVLYYSTARAVVRMATIVIVAWLTRDVIKVIWSLVAVEGAKCVFTLAATGRLFTTRLDADLLKRQLRYVVPLGTATALNRTNLQLSKLVISAKMGAGNLALYTIGAYQVPIINIVRSSIMDVLFPEMTQSDEAGRMLLWKRATVVLCFIILPVFTVFLWYARTVIETLFTPEYLPAVPIFRIYLSMMLLQCFDLASPLRAINRNVHFILGSVLSIVGNVSLILALFGLIGIVAPAIAYVAGETLFTIYLAWHVMRIYRIGFSRLAMWRKIGLITAGCIVCLPVLYAGGLVPMNAILRAVIFSALYLAVFVLVEWRLRIEEVDLLLAKVRRLVLSRIKKR
jgi:O-antigen/teichoic acid export membrane protein